MFWLRLEFVSRLLSFESKLEIGLKCQRLPLEKRMSFDVLNEKSEPEVLDGL